MVARIGGTIQIQLNGEIVSAKGEWTYNLGRPKRTMVVGADGIHGYTEEPQPAWIDGEITDRGNLDVNALVTLTNATVTARLANGKIVTLGGAIFTGDGDVGMKEGNIKVRFESDIAEETTA